VLNNDFKEKKHLALQSLKRHNITEESQAKQSIDAVQYHLL
jgi:hypothetical protein